MRKYLLGLGALAFVVIWIIGYIPACQRWPVDSIKPQKGAISPAMPGVITRVAIKPRERKIYKIQPMKPTEEFYLPPEGATADLTDKGNIEIRIKPAGAVFRPYIGLSLARTTNLELGADVFYWKRVAVGLGLQYGSAGLGASAHVGYNFWRSFNAGVGYDTKQDLNGLVYFQF